MLQLFFGAEELKCSRRVQLCIKLAANRHLKHTAHCVTYQDKYNKAVITVQVYRQHENLN